MSAEMFLRAEGNSGVGLSFGGKMGLVLLGLGLLVAGCQAGTKKVVQPLADEPGMARPLAGDQQGRGELAGEAAAEAATAEQIFEARIDGGAFDPLFVKSRLKLYGDRSDKWQVLEKKMRAYGLSHDQEKQWQRCSGLLTDIVSGYEAVLDGQGDSLAVIRQDIAFAESNCDEMFAVYTALIPDMLARFQKEASEQVVGMIDYYAERKEYQQVVAAYENAVDFQGKDLEDLRLKEIYGRALLHSGRLEKAAVVFSQVLAASNAYEKWPLRLEVAELLIALGQYEKARAEYLHLAEILDYWEELNKSVTDKLSLLFAADDHARELSLYSRALQAYISYDGESIPDAFDGAVRELQARYPGALHTRAALVLVQQVDDQVRRNVAINLARVERLVDAKEFKKGLDILTTMQQSRLPGDCQTQVAEAMSSLNAAHEHHVLLTREQRVLDMADQWQEGLNLLDMELYDESIAVFMGLLGTDYDSKAAAEIDKASLRAATLLRKKAAAIFIKVRQTDDPVARKALLKESRGYLQDILIRYPQVEIADKVVVNIQVIDEQLRSLDEM